MVQGSDKFAFYVTVHSLVLTLDRRPQCKTNHVAGYRNKSPTDARLSAACQEMRQCCAARRSAIALAMDLQREGVWAQPSAQTTTRMGTREGRGLFKFHR